MTEVVKEQPTDKVAEKGAQVQEQLSDKEINFRRLEASRDLEREARLKAEFQAQSLMKEIENIKQYLQPKEKDPLDEIEDIQDLSKDKLKEILYKREEQLQKKFENSLPQKLEELERNKRKTNFRDTLRGIYPDYDEVMNKDVIAEITEREPEAVQRISAKEDPYERCEEAYHFFKTMKKYTKPPKQEESPSIKDKVEENMQNLYFIPSGQGTPPPAVEFDVRSKSARQAAYDRLKAAQRRPVGGGHPARS